MTSDRHAHRRRRCTEHERGPPGHRDVLGHRERDAVVERVQRDAGQQRAGLHVEQAQQHAEDHQHAERLDRRAGGVHEPEHDAGDERAAGHADLLAQHAEHEAAEEQLLGQRRDEREQHGVADQRRCESSSARSRVSSGHRAGRRAWT